MSDTRRPSAEQVKNVLLKIPTFQLRRVFYEGLTNPQWVRPLLQAGAFASPPEPTVLGDGLTRDVFWPEVTYLINMAPHVPSDVVDVLLTLQWSNNPWVRRAAIEIGTVVPADQGARLIPMLKRWRTGGGFGWRTDPRYLVSFAVRLLEGDEDVLGRWLANELFNPKPEGEGYARKPTAGLDDYWYQQELPRVVEALRVNSFKAVTGWLRNWIDALPSYGSNEFSAAERSSIADLSTGEHPDPKHSLIDTVRDLALAGVSIDTPSAADYLVGRKRQLLHKVALFVVAESLRRETQLQSHDQQLIQVAKRLLADSTSYDDNMRIEYAELARATVLVDPGASVLLKEFIREGHLDDLRWMIEGLPRNGESDDDFAIEVADRASRSKHRWLSAIGDEALPPELQDELKALCSRWGDIKDPLERPDKVSSWVGPSAFSDPTDLEQMTPVELVEQLASLHYVGDGWGPEPSHEGQGRVLAALLTTKPFAVSGVGNLVGRLRPTYVRAILQGWTAALKADVELDWPEVVQLVSDTLTHPEASDFPSEGDGFDDDASFLPAKTAALRLLESLLRVRMNAQVPDGSLPSFASSLLKHGRDASAWSEYDSYQHDEASWSPLNLSLNWRWPIYVRALVILAVRDGGNPWRAAALEELDKELECKDSHGAVWAVVGEHLGQLLSTCSEWLEPRMERFFGGAAGVTTQQQCAVTTAMAIHHYHPRLYSLLREPLLAALALGNEVRAGWGTAAEAQARIGQWAISGLIYEDIEPDDPLVMAFFNGADAQVRGAAMSNVAWSFAQTKSVDAGIAARFGQLWDERIAHVRESPGDAAELRGIFWLVKSVAYDAPWWLPRLREALEFESDIKADRYLLGRELAQASVVDPENSLAVLELLLESVDGGMLEYDLSRHAVPIVIANALQSASESVARAGRSYMNVLGARGYLSLESEVRDVVSGVITPDQVEE